MRKVHVAVMVLAVVAGCVPSLHPLYERKDVAFEPALLGTWKQIDGEDTWHFARGDQKAYRLVYIDKEGRAGAFKVHLVKLDGKLFLDLFPERPEKSRLPDFYRLHTLPVHTFMAVRQIEPTLRLDLFDIEWLKKFLKADPAAIRHEMREDTPILTASTRELQAFVVKHRDTPKAFREGLKLRKVAAAKGQ